MPNSPETAAETIRLAAEAGLFGGSIKAGADVLFAPGLPDLDSVRAVCSSVSKPVNFMAGIPGRSFSVAELEARGVRRISLATSLYRVAMGSLLDAARRSKRAALSTTWVGPRTCPSCSAFLARMLRAGGGHDMAWRTPHA